MSVALITGAFGLIGSETVSLFHKEGFEVIGIDNDSRSQFFGNDASVTANGRHLTRILKKFKNHPIDIRNHTEIARLFSHYGHSTKVIVHAAAQPSHDWSASDPTLDFSVNAVGTQILLEAARNYCPDAVFVFTSSNKVYGDSPNRLSLVEQNTRFSIDGNHPFGVNGIDESMTIDKSLHSPFGVSKLCADILVQEYGKYFGLKTAVFRCGCITGPAQSGTKLQGFLSYLVKCLKAGASYTIYGYGGKQVRDILHVSDLANAVWEISSKPPAPGEVYNMGGSTQSNCSVVEAISLLESISGEQLKATFNETPRKGDHCWWISDVRKFRADYPNWQQRYSLEAILRQMVMELPNFFPLP